MKLRTAIIACLRHWRWRARTRLMRYGLAWRYATKQLSEQDAWEIADDCSHVSGIYPLCSLHRSGVLIDAKERWSRLPDIEERVFDACATVARKWSSDGETASVAAELAFQHIQDDAEREGIVLIDAWAFEDDLGEEGAL